MTGTSRLASRPLTVYVSPTTYLPVRVDYDGLRQGYRWLAPTKANLAKLTLRVAHGFQRITPK